MPERAGSAVNGRIAGWADGRIVALTRPCAVLLGSIALLSANPSIRLSAQVPPESLPPAPTVRDTSHQVGPVGALWRSLVLPGWGQAATGRKVTGALFTVWEGTTMFMTLKASQEANYFRASGSPNLESKHQEVQDWLVLWGFNHLFSGAEAFVAAHLRDFPRDLKIRAVPGGVGLRFALP
jgi:hypothetical protein